jgi:hypothetical protein
VGIREFVESMTSSPRTAEVAPLLVAVTAVRAGEVRVQPDHPDIAALVAGSTGNARAPGTVVAAR